MKYSEIYQLIFRFLICEDQYGDIISDIKNYVIPFENKLLKFIHLSSNHLVLPAVFLQLKQKGLTNFLPTDLAEHLNHIYILNKERNTKIIQQAEQINQKLSESVIQPVYFKGTGNLFDNLYLNPGGRIIGDIDFLVQKRDFLNAADSLMDLGYTTDIKIYDDSETLKDYPRLIHKDFPAAIEIHQMPVIPRYAKWFTTEKIFNDKKQISSQINCYVPSDKHKLAINFIHSQLSNKGHKLRIVSLRDLYDSFLISKRIDTLEVLNEINKKEQKKAKAYFDFSNAIISKNPKKHLLEKGSNGLYIQHKWFLNHPRIHRNFIFVVKLKDLLLNRFLLAFVDRSVMKNILVRIFDPKWWRNRLSRGFKEYFS